MTDGFSGRAASPRDGRRIRNIVSVSFAFLAAVLLILAWVGKGITIRALEDRWERFSAERATAYLAAAAQRFGAEQRTIRILAVDLAQSAEVQEHLSGRNRDTSALFEAVARLSAGRGVGTEIFDRTGTLLAWEGMSGSEESTDVARALKGQLVSSVHSTPITSQLFVICPVTTPDGIAGAVLVRQTIGVTYPLSERFVGRRDLAARLSEELGVSVTFRFDAAAAPAPDDRSVSGVLYGIDSARVGSVTVLKPAQAGYLQSIASTFDQVTGAILLLLLLTSGVLAVRLILRASLARGAKAAGVILAVWGVRLLMIWAGVPSPTLVSGGIFDPAVFATTFAGGIARSAGEMAITGIALALSILIPGRLFLLRRLGEPPLRHRGSAAGRGILLLAAAAGIPLLLRAYAAVVRSAVFDSTLVYNDPRVVAPSLELGVMMLNLFVLSAAVAVVCAFLAAYVLTGIAGGSAGLARRLAWVIGGAALGAVSVLYGLLHPSPLTTDLERLGFILILVVWAWRLDRRARRLRDLVTMQNFLITMGVAAALLYPVLEGFVAEKDKDHMRFFAADYLQPVDGWLTTIVDEALQGFVDRETGPTLLDGDTESVERLAFSAWAGSTISKEGYNCLFLVTDAAGAPVSRFEIGGSAEVPRDLADVIATDDDRNIQVTDIGSGQGTVKVYSGTVPLRAEGDTLVGFARVVVSAEQQALFRGESPAILRGSLSGPAGSFLRPVIASEYRNGRLLASSSPLWPMNLPVPGEVLVAFRDPASPAVWHEEEIDGVRYETLYARPVAGSPRILGLSVPKPTLLVRLNALLRYLIYVAAIAALVALGALAVRAARGTPYAFTFRDRLLAALLATALLPMVIIALYARNEAAGRVLATAADRLDRETAAIALSLQQGAMDWRSGALGGGVAEMIAGELGTDFNLYLGNRLAATSRPELYEAGILDRRLSGAAYAGVVQQGKRFFVQTETIGQYTYAVGYRPLAVASGGVTAVVSVPTLYRQDAIDRQVAEQNAVVFGVYALAVLGILVIASTFANRIAAPIQRLTQATRRVAAGDLDVPLGDVRAEGEVGELVRSFGSMTEELKRSRESVRRFERQAAWSEMARQVAHEIKNPLTPMKLTLQHLRELFSDGAPEFRAQFEKGAAMIIGQIEALSRIASEFSSYARMPQPRLEPVDVNAVMRESAHLFDREEGISFNASYGAELPAVMADREGLRRVFVNIVRNAIQAMPDGGTVSVTTRKSGRSVVVTVADTGTGIPEDVMPRLFQPNFSTKTEGMGLGLAIVKRILDDLDGTIGIDSEAGAGTTVTITLPLP
jgi:signal transduction histidine kinase